MPFGIPAEQIVDAEVVTAHDAPTVDQYIRHDTSGVVNIPGAMPLVDPTSHAVDPLAKWQGRARAMTIFIKIPLLTFIALHDKTPALVRLGAGLLAIWEAVELAQSNELAGAQGAAQQWIEEYQG